VSSFFNEENATGTLIEESMIGKNPDDDDDASGTAAQNPTPQQPLVFKLLIGWTSEQKARRTDTLTRLDVLKQMFDAYVNRTLAYNLPTHLGLVTFGTKATLVQKITNAVEEFRQKLNRTSALGDTALWDSELDPSRLDTERYWLSADLALAQDQLEHYAEKFPKAKLRIICISDGEDNKSTHNSFEVTQNLRRARIIVESFCLGDASNTDLKTLSHLTGGFTFEPKTLEEAMAICKLEPVLSSLERPDPETNKQPYGHKQFLANPSSYTFCQVGRHVQVQRVSRDVFPKRKQHPQLAEDFVELGAFAKASSQVRTDANLRLSRIHTEIRNSGAHSHPDYDIYICEPNMGLWKVVMQGRFLHWPSVLRSRLLTTA
jgi:hypothetical protein